MINDIRYKSRRSIDWSEIEIYLKQYIGEYYEILESSDKVFVGTDFQMNLLILRIQKM